METRKLQEVGGGTYTVSIPKQWATAQGLEAGTAVNLHTHLDGSIVVRSCAKDGGDLEATRIEVDGGDPVVVTRTLRAAQAVGFKRVTIACEGSFGPEARRAVNSMARGLVGTEVVDERDGEITVQTLLDASDISVRQSVVQLAFVTHSIHRQATAAFLDADDAADRLQEREAEAERLFRIVARHFNRALVSLEEIDRLGITRPELFDYYEAARHLRAVAQEAVRLARTAEDLSGPLPDDVADDVRSITDATREVVEVASSEVVEGHDADALDRALAERDEARTRIDAFDRALTDESEPTVFDSVSDAIAVARTLDTCGRTLEHGTAIADVALRSLARTEGL